jgi:hypothetical protein
MKEIEKKKLSLKKESLRRLQSSSLEQVVGGAGNPALTAQWWCTSDPCRTDSCRPTACV